MGTVKAMADSPSIPATILRRLAAAHDVDQRSILRELREPGSVRGMAGDRCRQALTAYRAREQSLTKSEVR